MNIKLTESQVQDLKGMYFVDKGVFKELAGQILEKLVVMADENEQ